MRYGLKLILTLSILLNIALVGLIAGGSYRVFRHFGPDPDLRKEMDSLPPEVRARIDGVFADAREEMFALFKEERSARAAVRAALNADPFIPEDYEQAADDLNRIKLKMLEGRARKTGAIASQLSAEDRRKFSGYLLRGMRHDKFRGEDGPSRLPPPEKQSAASTESEEPLTGSTTTKERQTASSAKVGGRDWPFDAVMLPMPDFDNEKF
ncbi:MAG: periplasmic heavy metal sensor [Rhodospirillales bacterium]|nr:periplasmic heavy metal sensor [Rhodospirillales bacterium]MCB9964507.1 periplasmic heavy metal sensor [Rhodospirillales bacterium]MCB9973780.1 periplasmic heavy metal sensor [Rhodospirillales bacterium]MCB9980336.1 periplasmic heavy metal sensor [Rhodospirillales bacterium]